MQLWHVGRISHLVFQPGGALPVAPSALPVPSKTFIIDERSEGVWADVPVPQALTVDGIARIVADYAQSARNAIAAGTDGVEIHAANGYLLDQFINSASNIRTDRYGGTIVNRIRLLVEVVDAVTSAVVTSHVAVRLTPMGRFMGMGDDTPEETLGRIAEGLNRRGLAYLHVVEPSTLGIETEAQWDSRRDGMVRVMRKRFAGMLMLAGGYTRATAERALGEGRGDVIAFGKLFIANPDLPDRFAQDAGLSALNPSSFFGVTARGYVDYPTLGEVT